MKKSYPLKDFIPLIVIFLLILTITGIKQVYSGFDIMGCMQDFMASFFIIFSLFKIINLKGFAQAYREYDIIAKHTIFYAYVYPFIELVLGIAYVMRWHPMLLNTITAMVMLISSIGVAQELMKKRSIPCACLGVVFKIPMTYVTLLEDLLMAAMALIMIVLSR